jgi:hypothetical protein
MGNNGGPRRRRGTWGCWPKKINSAPFYVHLHKPVLKATICTKYQTTKDHYYWYRGKKKKAFFCTCIKTFEKNTNV